MNKLRIIIEKFNYLGDYYEILDNNGEKYYLEIKNGSIDCDICTETDKYVGFKYLDENDLIEIEYLLLKDKKIIKKILINEKYDLLMDSDEENDINDYL